MPDIVRRAGSPHPVPHVDPPRAQDPRFAEVVPHGARLVSLYDDAIFSEGPVWWPVRRMLVWSDVEGPRVLGWREDRCVEVVVDATPFISGHTVDHASNLVHCEHGNRRLSRTTPDGHYEPLVGTYRGRRFNSPDDVVCAADGALWFTDPSYGLTLPKQGALAEPELDHRSVYRVDPISALALSRGQIDETCRGWDHIPAVDSVGKEHLVRRPLPTSAQRAFHQSFSQIFIESWRRQRTTIRPHSARVIATGLERCPCEASLPDQLR
ncbi:SMP-30/gluconolactonase/LRE family protein [Methylobacterium sp. CM6257]